MQQITPNVFAETRTRGCNPGYLVTTRGVVVIDTPQLPTQAVKMYEEAKSRGPIRYLINTEHHVDHIIGNYYFKEVEHVLSHKATYEQFMTVYPQINPYEYAREAVQMDDPEGMAIFPDEETYFKDPHKPDIVIDGDAVLRVGSHSVEILWTPGHTPGQLAVVIPEERVAFVGDTIFNGCQTWLYTSDLDAWFKSLDRLLELDVDYIVPGHGPVCGPQEVYVQRAFLLEWKTAVAVAVGKGWSKEKCVREISFMDRFPVDIGQEYMADQVTTNNVAALYDQLTSKRTPRAGAA